MPGGEQASAVVAGAQACHRANHGHPPTRSTGIETDPAPAPIASPTVPTCSTPPVGDQKHGAIPGCSRGAGEKEAPAVVAAVAGGSDDRRPERHCHGHGVHHAG